MRYALHKIVNDILKDENSPYRKAYAPFINMFEDMSVLEICFLLKEKRRGSVNFDLPECEANSS